MIRAEKISKRYQNGAGEFLAVNEADFTIAKGDFVLVIGRSGSGKSTLLSMLGGLTRPSGGTVRATSAWNALRGPESPLNGALWTTSEGLNPA